ncbi:MAG: hypothetical protein HN469_00560, partial [Candidatus Marinimicrobia bacterium]|nr:hypothetical protein [Candidatus Neomarinimicrobiota bacterium]
MIRPFKTIYLPFLFLAIWSCADLYNKSNEIIAITASDLTVRGGLTVQLACEASDQDGDILSYIWESGSGSLVQNGDSATWTAPADTGVYFITCTIADDYGASAVGSIAIKVTRPSLVPVSGLDWTLTDDGLINGTNSSNENNTGITDYWDGTVENADFGWNVTIQEETDSSITQSLQFKVEDSANCGGGNGNTQNGTATANIQVNGSSPLTLELDFSGIGEAQSAGYDRIIFYLDGNVIG